MPALWTTAFLLALPNDCIFPDQEHQLIPIGTQKPSSESGDLEEFDAESKTTNPPEYRRV